MTKAFGAWAKAPKEAEDKVRLLGVVVVHLFTCFEEAVGSRGVGISHRRVMVLDEALQGFVYFL